MVITFAGELTKRNTLYSFLHGESPDCHFDIVFFATGTNLCRFFSLYLIYSKLIPKTVVSKITCEDSGTLCYFHHLNILHMSLASS